MANRNLLQKYNRPFTAELARLNARQRHAVDQIEGPVLVIAGPGTGKTHILTARIGRILIETDTQAHNILCLTFTDAGVQAMRERLLEFIGPEAHRVHIYTFHSFCNNIIQDNLELFGRHDLEPLSELERVEMIRNIIDDLPVGHLLRQRGGDPYFYERHLQDLFSRMKSENWSVAKVNQAIDQYLAELPDRSEFIYQRNSGPYKKGDVKANKLEEVQHRMARLRAAVALFPQYVTLMEEARRYDFDDMILWVLRAFEENENLLRVYQEQYLYFLIDEYQDTNGAQNQIIQQLISYWQNPNIFIVGDDDQSIYEFQGARLKNLVDFYAHYKNELTVVILQENYRSSQMILDASNALITQNERRIIKSLHDLGLEKLLVASHQSYARSTLLPAVTVYRNKAHEEADLVFQIQELHQQGFPLNEVGIIYAKHRQARNIIALFEQKGIPYNTKRRVNILDLPIIRNLRLLLEYIQLEHNRPHSGNFLLFRILHFDFLGIDIQDLTQLGVFVARQDNSDQLKWMEVINDPVLLERAGVKNIQSILDFGNLLWILISNLDNIPLPVLIERVINRSGLLQHIVQQTARVWLLQVMTSFVDFVVKETDRTPRLSLKRLLEIFTSMDENRLPIAVHKTVSAKDGVNLLTAHGSKGLEFQYVYLIDCTKDHWEPRGRGSRFRFPIPDTLTYSGEEDAMEARRRLFYVAMTRAKERLHISYSKQDNTGKSVQRALFIDEILSLTPLISREKAPDPVVLLEAQQLLLTELDLPQIEVPPKDTLDALLEGFVLSISALNRFLSCPLEFYYEQVLKIPVVTSEAAAYGTALHHALRRLFEKMLGNEQKDFPEEKQFIKMFAYEMRSQRGYFSKKEYERRLAFGKQYLSQYYRQHIHHWNKKVRVEWDIRNVVLEGVPLKGIIDKVEFHDKNRVHIVDYKTGSQNPAKLSRPGKVNPIGGSYWRQLVFYKILFENHRNNHQRVRSAEISYLEPDKKGDLLRKELIFTMQDVEIVTGLIKDTYHRVLAHDFFQGCGEKHCQWCNFARHNIRPDSFADPEIELLDDHFMQR